MAEKSLDAEQLEDLYAAFSELKTTHSIPWDDLKRALEVLGAPLAGHELRELAGPVRQSVSLTELADLFEKAKDLKDTSKLIKKSLLLKQAQDVQAIVRDPTEDGGVRHTVSKAEERGFTAWINKRLADDSDCKNNLIPIDHTVDGQLYERCKDGIILCKLINIAAPNTIDERTINKGTALKVVFKVNENLTLVVNSAAAIGCCVVNIGPEDITNGTRHLVLGLIWQLIRKGLVDTITLTRHSELVALLREGEKPEDLHRLRPEDILLRWVNHHLEKAGIARRVNNFNDDIVDSTVYSHLLYQIAPADKRSKLMTPNTILSQADLHTRATNVLANAEILNARTFLTPEDICRANERGNENRDRLNLGFVANLFNMYPGLDADQVGIEIEAESLEEKTYRNWMNSMGVQPAVTHLYTDLSSGCVLLELIDIIKPGTVNWSRVVTKFDPKKRLFQEQGNCNLVIEYCKVINVKLVNVSGEDIREQDKKLVLGVCFQLMRAYTFKLLREASGGDGSAPCEDKHVLAWSNLQLQAAGAKPLQSFRDVELITGKPVLHVLEYLRPGSTDKSIWLTGSGDNFSNCCYAISACRKAGARVYALPEHLRDLHMKMILTIFACLMVLHYQIQALKS